MTETIEFNGKKIKTRSPHYLSGEGWRIQLVDGLNDLKQEEIDQVRSFEGIEQYIKRGAIIFRQKAETPFQRRQELELIAEDQGVAAIAELGAKYGIRKPKTGWKDAIPLIVEYEMGAVPTKRVSARAIVSKEEEIEIVTEEKPGRSARRISDNPLADQG